MGKAHKHEPAPEPPPQPEDEEQTAPATTTSSDPDDPALRAAQSIIGQPRLMYIEGHLRLVTITSFIPDQGYRGVAWIDRNDTGEPSFEIVDGIREYPYEQRPDYKFQCILPGQRTAGIRKIAGLP